MSKINFITVSTYRSGSSVFMRWLDSVQFIKARQELLRGKIPKGIEAFLLDFYFNSRGNHKALGFKYQYRKDEAQAKVVIDFIKKNDIKVIHLIRNNILDTMFWYEGNYEGETVGGFGKDLILKSDKVKGNIDNIIKTFEWVNTRIDRWNELADLIVTYEDMTNGVDATHFYNKKKAIEIFKLLNAYDEKLDLYDKPLPMKKAKRPPLSECCTNYEEIINELNKRNIRYIYEGTNNS